MVADFVIYYTRTTISHGFRFLVILHQNHNVSFCVVVFLYFCLFVFLSFCFKVVRLYGLEVRNVAEIQIPGYIIIYNPKNHNGRREGKTKLNSRDASATREKRNFLGFFQMGHHPLRKPFVEEKLAAAQWTQKLTPWPELISLITNLATSGQICI